MAANTYYWTSGDHSAKSTAWSVHEREDRWIFHRTPIILGPDRTIFSIRDRDLRTVYQIFLHQTAVDASAEALPGAQVFTRWELMKPHAGEHPVPHFRAPKIGPYSNWVFANKSGFRAAWVHPDGKLRSHYYQRSFLPRFLDEGGPIALASYAYGIMIYSYFARVVYLHTPSIIPKVGVAREVVIMPNDANGRTRTTNIKLPLLRSSEPFTFDQDNTRRLMERAGYENVDGAWQGLKWDWLYDRASWIEGVVPEAKVIDTYKQRTSCDACVIRDATSGPNMPRSICTKVDFEGVNTCEICFKAGLLCSWSKLPFLFGRYWRNCIIFRNNAGDPVIEHTENLIMKLPNSAGCQAEETQFPAPWLLNVR